MSQKVVVIGQGYVGLPLAVRAAEAGYQVVGLDKDETRVKMLDKGASYIADVSAARLEAVLRQEKYRPSADPRDIAGFDFCVVAVPTPLAGREPDLTYLEDAGRMVAPFVRAGSVVILESTSYPGTTEDVLRPLLEQGSGLKAPQDFHLGFSPERIDPGNHSWSLENTPKVVSGMDAASLSRVQSFYENLVCHTVPVSSPRTAELSKLLENTFRQVNIALVNELAQVCGHLGCDLWEAIDAAATKPFGYMPFRPGPGVGGHCLPIDPAYLSWYTARVTGSPLRMVEAAGTINHSMPAHVVARIGAKVPLKEARVLLLGLSYKKNNADLRESPSLEVAQLLLDAGARVRVCDPLVPTASVPMDMELVPLLPGELEAADAVVLLTDHDCFDYDLIERTASYIFDTRNRCHAANVDRL